VHFANLVTNRLGFDSDINRRVLGWDPFLLDARSASAATKFEVEVLVESVRYVYGLEFTETGLTGEWLHAYPQGRRQVWFERDPASPADFRFPDNHLGSSQAVLAELARPDRPFLGLAEGIRHDRLSPLARWFEQVRTAGGRAVLGPTTRRAAQSLVAMFDGDRGERVIEMLRRADLGVEGVDVIQVAPSDRDLELGAQVRREVRLRHKGSKGVFTSFPLRAESEGTIAWLQTLRPLLQILDEGGVLVVDELDASLHPELAAETIRMFYDRRLNTSGAQLLFSSHDVTMLSTGLGSPLLERDQVWFTDKDDEGATDLYALAELKPRKGENIERGFLAGRYGSVPGLSPGELARALWPTGTVEESE
jgi:AAA domain, putative AbiEii toxin, Type IV TA system